MSKSKTKKSIFPIIIYNKFIPFDGFLAMVTLFILWIRREHKGDTRRLNERFFMKQFMYINRQKFGLHQLLFLSYVVYYLIYHGGGCLLLL